MLKCIPRVVLLFPLLCANDAISSVVIDPDIGLSGSFSWTGGLGPIDGIDGTNEDTWSIDLALPGTIDISVSDQGTGGDAFELVFDGEITNWTMSGFDNGFFFATYDDLLLPAGSHTFTLNVVQDCCGGGTLTSYSFSAVSSVSSVSEPASIALLGFGVLGLVYRWRYSKA